MKKKLLFLSCSMLLWFTSSMAQYTVSVSNGGYSDLTGATNLTYAPLESGFYFSSSLIFGTFKNHYANFNTQAANPISAGGFMNKTGFLVTYDSIGKNDVVVFQCFDNYNFSVVSGTTTAAVKLEGTSGSRILKCQWKNLVYNSNTSQTANFQVWLHEADGSISYHYGPNTLPPATTVYDGGYTGIVIVKGDGSSILEEINLEGKPSAPVIYRDIHTSGLPTLDTLPPNGMVYTFSKAATAVQVPIAAQHFALYPNPAGDMLHLSGDIPTGARGAIYNSEGRLIKEVQDIRNGQVSVDELAAGSYVLRLYTGVEIICTQQFLKL